MNKEFIEKNVKEILEIAVANHTDDTDSCDNIIYVDEAITEALPLIAKLQCPKCKDIRYMDYKELLRLWKLFIDDEPIGDQSMAEDFLQSVSELAIPDNKKIKELEDQSAAMEESYIKAFKEQDAENDRLKGIIDSHCVDR